MKTLVSSLSQQLALPMITQAIEYVNNKENELESKVVNFWNSVSDMLNKKFKGKLKKSNNHLKKVSTTRKKSDKSDDAIEEKRKVKNQKQESKTSVKEIKSNHIITNAAKVEAQRAISSINDASRSSIIYNNSKPASIIGKSLMPNYLNLNSSMIYSNGQNPIYFKLATCNPFPIHPIYSSFMQYPQVRSAGNFIYIPIHQN